MTTETYRELCETLKLVAEASERHAEGRERLEDWRTWARGVTAGLYQARSAERAARSALAVATSCTHAPGLVDIARAAALAADAVVVAARQDDAAARAQVFTVRRMLGTRFSTG